MAVMRTSNMRLILTSRFDRFSLKTAYLSAQKGREVNEIVQG